MDRDREPARLPQGEEGPAGPMEGAEVERGDREDATKPTFIRVDETTERVVVEVTRRPRHPAERVIWFLFFGWMAGLVLVAAAAVLNFTAIGYIFRPWALQQLPRVMRLAEPSQRIVGPPTPKEREQEVRERPYIRAVYFFAVGWWAGVIWLLLAYLVNLPQVTEQISLWMYNRVDAITTLERRSEELISSP